MAVDNTIEGGRSFGRLTGIAMFSLLFVLATLPAFAGGLAIDKLTTLLVFVLLAAMWNLLAGYAGLASVGQQVFFGLGGYFALRLVDAGIPPYMALLLGACGAATAAVPLSYFVLRLKGGEFAIAMWWPRECACWSCSIRSSRARPAPR